MRFLMRSYRPSRVETKTTNNADDNGFESKRIALKMFQDRLKWKLLKTVSLYFGRVSADDGRKRIKKSIGFRMNENAPVKARRKQNASVGEIIFLRFGCGGNGYFSKTY